MKRIAILVVTLGVAGGPVLAEDPAPEPRGDVREGFSLLEEGTRLLLRGLMDEMEPALRELQGALGNLDAYHPPEVLPNGDIIIRRKEPRVPPTTPEIGPGGDVEL